MNKTHPLPFLFILLAIFGLPGSLGATVPEAASSNASAPGVKVEGAWVRWLPADLPAAAYLTLVNATDTDWVLVGASSPDYMMVHLHESITTEDGMSKMRSVSQIRVPAHGKLTAKPGGLHLMLMKAKRPIKPGEMVTINLDFANGECIAVEVPVKPAGHRE